MSKIISFCQTYFLFLKPFKRQLLAGSGLLVAVCSTMILLQPSQPANAFSSSQITIESAQIQFKPSKVSWVSAHHLLPPPNDLKLAKLTTHLHDNMVAPFSTRFDQALWQYQVASYISKTYYISQANSVDIVKAAVSAGKSVNLDPALILAVMEVESSYNPRAQSRAGAEGIMQVMTTVHHNKYTALFGKSGERIVFNAPMNIKVGAWVLKECLAKSSTLSAGLRRYLGTTARDDGGYGARIFLLRNKFLSM